MIASQTVDKVLSQVSIVEVIGSYVRLEPRGKNHIGFCPFHEDKRRPSFSVSEEKGVYHCFACHASGNSVQFLMRYRQWDFMTALRELARIAHVDLEPAGADSGIQARLLEMHRLAEAWFQEMLQSSPLAQDYLASRGIGLDIQKRFALGYGGDGWAQLGEHLQRAGFSAQEVQASSLVSQTKTSWVDRFRGRLIFPIHDLRGQSIAFGGRILQDNPQLAKYLNSSETPLFQKGRVLYGMDGAKDAISREKSVILVEGYMDVIALHQVGLTQAVAPLGTGLTEFQARLLSRYADRVVLLLDGDEAGQKATQRALQILLKFPLEVEVWALPSGEDPDTCLRKHGKAAFLEQVERHDPLTYQMQRAEQKFPPKTHLLTYLAELFEYIRLFESPLEREEACQRIARKLGRNGDLILQEYARFERDGRQFHTRAMQTPQVEPTNPLELLFVAGAFVYAGHIQRFWEMAPGAMLGDASLRELYGALYIKVWEGGLPPDWKLDQLLQDVEHEGLRDKITQVALEDNVDMFGVLEMGYRIRLRSLEHEAHAAPVEQLLPLRQERAQVEQLLQTFSAAHLEYVEVCQEVSRLTNLAEGARHFAQRMHSLQKEKQVLEQKLQQLSDGSQFD